MQNAKRFRAAKASGAFQRIQAVTGPSAVQLDDEVQRSRRDPHAFVDVAAAQMARRKLREVERAGQRVVVTPLTQAASEGSDRLVPLAQLRPRHTDRGEQLWLVEEPQPLGQITLRVEVLHSQRKRSSS